MISCRTTDCGSPLCKLTKVVRVCKQAGASWALIYTARGRVLFLEQNTPFMGELLSIVVAACAWTTASSRSRSHAHAHFGHKTPNADKTELVAMTKGKYSERTHEMVGQDIISQTEAKCLGVWWRYDLSPGKAVDECIHKARRAFFALGSIGAFHGRLNPLTCRSLFETFVVPTMLYECET